MTRDQAVQAARVLKALIKYAEAAKILGTFINALKEKSVLKEDGNYYLHGNFNMNGTKSGRQSSSNPNLTNLPSGSTYGKLIKSCFKSPKGRVMIGADFDSLEDKISALTTRDPNKMRVYEDGYDGHSLRAFAYFPEKLGDIPSKMNLTAGERVFKITNMDGSTYYAKGSDIMGASAITVESNYESNKRL